MVKFLIQRPVAVIMVFIALVLLGVICAQRIPISPLPNIDIPEIIVHVSKKNTSAIELESVVVKELRQKLQQVAELDDIHTETRDDYANLKLRFKYGTDINFAFIEVNDKIDLAMNSLPRDVERPRVVKSTLADIPVFHINLTLKDTTSSANNSFHFLELSDFASQVIKRRLEQLPEIALVDITGLSESEIYIKPDIAAMRGLKLKIEDFKEVVEKNNLLNGNLSATDGQLQYNVRFSMKNSNSAGDIENLSLKHNDRIFRIKDIAKVGIREKQSKGSFIANTGKAINLAIIKQSDTRLDDLRRSTSKLLADFQHDYPEIKFEQIQDQTELLEFSITNLKQDLFYGSLLAFIMMFFFLRNARAPILIGITIPVSLALTILFFNLIHLTINIISLSGLVLGMGLMIDNSIIVIENITQHMGRGMRLLDACIKGTTEIIRPLLSSALTTCSVFLPLIFLSGISGAIFYDQAMAIMIGLSVSLIVSITLLPVLFHLFHSGKVRSFDLVFFRKYNSNIFERIYQAGFRWTFNNKTVSVIIVMTLITSNIFLFKHLNKERLPALEQTELLTSIDWNSNISISENARRVKNLIRRLGEHVVISNAMIGEQQYLLSKEKELSSSETLVYLKVRESRFLNDLKKNISKYLRDNYPNATWKINPPKSIFEKIFGESQSTLVIRISQMGNQTLPERHQIDEIVKIIRKKFNSAELSREGMQNSIALNINTEKLLLYKISLKELFESVKSSLNSSEIGVLRKGQLQVPIVVVNEISDLNSVIRNLTVKNSDGVSYPISDIINIKKEESYKTINGDKGGNFIHLLVETENPIEITNFLYSQLKGSANTDISFSGSYYSNRELIKEMALVMAVAVLLLYFILAAQFESLIQPLIVLFELPISLSGALILLFVFNSSINLISLIGMVVMCGIIINDSILKIDTINQLRRNENFSLMEAIHTGGLRRLKSIIMTSMTTILSVSPFLFGSDMGSMLQRPLSLALIGGMLIGTPVSLYFIPLVYWYYYRNSDKALRN